MIIKLSKSVATKCAEFAALCVETNKYYASRGQKNMEKIKNDIFVGKLGEWACYKSLKDYGIEVEEPDMEIYARGKKSHSADLFTPSLNFSVKTQTLESVERYGMSWLMEKSALNKFDGHQVILCLYLENNRVLIQNMIPFEQMLKVQSSPKLAYLTTKAAFYYEDIIYDKLKGDQ